MRSPEYEDHDEDAIPPHVWPHPELLAETTARYPYSVLLNALALDIRESDQEEVKHYLETIVYCLSLLEEQMRSLTLLPPKGSLRQVPQSVIDGCLEQCTELANSIRITPEHMPFSVLDFLMRKIMECDPLSPAVLRLRLYKKRNWQDFPYLALSVLSHADVQQTLTRKLARDCIDLHLMSWPALSTRARDAARYGYTLTRICQDVIQTAVQEVLKELSLDAAALKHVAVTPDSFLQLSPHLVATGACEGCYIVLYARSETLIAHDSQDGPSASPRILEESYLSGGHLATSIPPGSALLIHTSLHDGDFSLEDLFARYHLRCVRPDLWQVYLVAFLDNTLEEEQTGDEEEVQPADDFCTYYAPEVASPHHPLSNVAWYQTLRACGFLSEAISASVYDQQSGYIQTDPLVVFDMQRGEVLLQDHTFADEHEATVLCRLYPHVTRYADHPADL